MECVSFNHIIQHNALVHCVIVRTRHNILYYCTRLIVYSRYYYVFLSTITLFIFGFSIIAKSQISSDIKEPKRNQNIIRLWMRHIIQSKMW